MDNNVNSHINDEDMKIKLKLTAIGNNEIEYIHVTWSALEEIMLVDFNSFKMIQDHYDKTEMYMNDSEKTISDATQFSFYNNDKPSIIVIKSGSETGLM